MEEGSQALLIAFAILVFIIALSISFSSLNSAKKTADVVLYYSDRDNFQEYVSADENDLNGGRTVGIDTVIATVLRCGKENFAVRVVERNNETIFDYSLDSIPELEEKITNKAKIKFCK